MAKVTPRLIDLIVGGINRADEVGKIDIKSSPDDSAFLTFAKSRAGGQRAYAIGMTMAQDHASGTLWDLVWTGGGTEVVVRYAPYGNTTASVTQPHYTATAIVSEPDGTLMGGEATQSVRAQATIEVEWEFKDRPAKVTS